MVALCKPEHVHWCDGSRKSTTALPAAGGRRHVPQAGSGKRPALPAWSDRATWRASRTAPSSARREGDAGPPNNWLPPAEMRATLRRCLTLHAGRTMYVVPFSMGPLGAHRPHRHRAVRQRLFRGNNADHDAHGQGRVRRAGVEGEFVPAFTRWARRSSGPGDVSCPATRPSTSSTIQRRARSGRTAPATAAMPAGKKCFACASPNHGA